ncbi:MAG: YceD family protein [Chloroflexota bacterium]
MPLQFNISQLLKGGVGEARSLEFQADSPLDLDGTAARDIHGEVRLTLTNFGVLARGEAAATLDLTCSRCLEAFELTVAISFEEEFQPSIDISSGLPSRVPRLEGSFPISSNHTIDLREPLRQQFLLAIDLIPVCDEACKGLCPTCGVNLNQQTCDCEPEPQDSPLAVLQTLLSQPDTGTEEKP